MKVVWPVPPFPTARVPVMSARVEVAPLYTFPAESTPRPPAERAVSQVEPEFEKAVVEAYVAKVEEAMREKGEVALSQRPVEVAETAIPLYESGVKGKPWVSVPVMVTGEEPKTLKVVQEVEPLQVTEVVATLVTPAPPVE